MPVWSFHNTIRDINLLKSLSYWRPPWCLCCGRNQKLLELPGSQIHTDYAAAPGYERFAFLPYGCERCGWWMARNEYISDSQGALEYSRQVSIAGAQIVSLDDTPLHHEVAEARRELIRTETQSKYEIDPYRLEDVVASVFRNFGYSVRVTGKSRDGGLDIILDGPFDALVGVQVKRSEGKIGVSQIRELIGALVIRKLTDGVFVTLSDFTRDANKLVYEAASAGYRIELINGSQFFSALHLTERDCLPNGDEIDRLLSPESYLTVEDETWGYEQGLTGGF